MSLQERQDKAAADLVDALARIRTGLTDEARVVLMRVCSGHERRTVALLSKAAAEVRQSGMPPPPPDSLPGRRRIRIFDVLFRRPAM